MRLWVRTTNEPWAITESALQTILDIALRQNETPEAVAAKLGRELRNTHTVIERDGVAVIPVVGPLFRYANLFTQISGATSYEILARDFTEAVNNPDIHSIILDIDSPGGEVNGVSELAEMIHATRGSKPIVAYASGDAASGAYWIAAAADEIVASATSALGSIGVVGVFHKRGKDHEAQSAIEIVSSQSPHKRLDPETDAGFSRLQIRINNMAQVFLEQVAAYRGQSTDYVQNTFGGGDVLIGAAAVNVGLADRLGSLEGLIQELSEVNQQSGQSADPNNPPTAEGFLMPNLNPNPQSTQEKTSMNIEQLQAEQPELLAQLQAQSRQEERERIAAILEHETAAGRTELAHHLAFHTDTAAESACAVLAAAPKEHLEAINPLQAAMSQIPNPTLHPSGDEQGDDVTDIAKQIAAAGK
jgi:signal peptide peptidase SppA